MEGIDVKKYEDDESAPKVITQDRSNISIIVSEMLDPSDDNLLYPTTLAYNKLERLMKAIRMESIGWAWAEACCQLDRGEDPREFEIPLLIKRAEEELILECKP